MIEGTQTNDSSSQDMDDSVFMGAGDSNKRDVDKQDTESTSFI